MSEQYWKDRADALERAAQEVLSNFMNDERCVFCATNETHAPYSADEHETWCPVRSVKAALDRQEPDQPTQDGGRVSAVSDTAVLQRAAEREKQARKTAERRQDGGLLDPYTLEWIARDCERRAEELCEAARENRQGCARGSYRDREANHLENEAHSLMKRAEYYRNLQTDQPADASEPSCCARTRAEERERCAQIADEDNPAHSKLDRYTADEIAAAIRRTVLNGGSHDQ